jgi:hypothetical protein
MTTSQAHVADIGRLLMSVQQELRDIRGQVGSATVSAPQDALVAALDRAEAHLAAKAEVVLRTAANEYAVTLPAIPRHPPQSDQGFNYVCDYFGEGVSSFFFLVFLFGNSV